MEEYIKDLGYLALFAYSFGGGFAGLVIAGILSYAGDLNIYISILVAGIANFIGDQFLFYLARSNKAHAKDMMSKYGRKIAYTHLLMRRYGSFAVFFQKYIYGIKTLIPLAMGLTKYSFTKFTIFNFFATIIWACLVGFASYTAGEYILNAADEFKYIGIAVVATIILTTMYIFKKI